MRVYAKVVEVDKCSNAYIVKTRKGSILRRNRWHLIPVRSKQCPGSSSHYVPMWIDDVNMQAANEGRSSKTDEQVVDDKLKLKENDTSVQEVDEMLEKGSANIELDSNEVNTFPRRSKRNRRPNSRFREFFLY